MAFAGDEELGANPPIWLLVLLEEELAAREGLIGQALDREVFEGLGRLMVDRDAAERAASGFVNA